MLGISIFLGEELTEETEQYLYKMNESGFSGIFSSLHIPEDNVSHYRKRLAKLSSFAKKLNMELMVDISGEALTKIGLSFDRPTEILTTGITGLRMDYAISNKTIAAVSNHLKVALNASTISEQDVRELREFGANFENMEAWHNYYPRPETGLDMPTFLEKNNWLKNLGFRIMAFVPGDGKLRGPLFQQLPTLEDHRFKHPLACSIELTKTGSVDDIYIGDPSIIDETREQFKAYYQEQVLILKYTQVSRNPIYLDLITGNHWNRMDPARDVLRSAKARFKPRVEIKPEENLQPRSKGSITIDNELYGRYMGEIQITKLDLKADEKVNTIAKVVETDLDLIDWCLAGQQFKLKPMN